LQALTLAPHDAEGLMGKAPKPKSTTNGRAAEVAALLKAARAVLENRAFADAATAILAACKTILGADAGFVAVSAAGGKGFEVVCLDPGGLGFDPAGGVPPPFAASPPASPRPA